MPYFVWQISFKRYIFYPDARMIIRRMKQTDIDQVTRVHESGFPRHKNAREWICCNFSAYPRMQYFVAESEETGEILGYLQ